MASTKKTFQWPDYLIFAMVLVVSSGIGVYHAIQARRSRHLTSDLLLTGRKQLQILPVTFSLAASFMSAIFVLGVPAEVYVNGGQYWIIAFGYIPTFIIVAAFFVPLFYKLRLTSAYEYLEMRFSKTVRIMASVTFTLEMVIYLGVVTYAPALALSQVTGFSMELSILTVGLVCTFYTSIGGIKAVVWTDVFQLLVITAGMLALIIQGAINVGGWDVIFDRARKGERMPYFEFNPDPFTRHTFWSLLIGGFFTTLTIYGANQAILQRYMNMKSLIGAEISLILNLPLSVFYLCLVCLTGLVLYSRYYNDDPLLSGEIGKADQIVPLFVMETLSFLPGLAGLFVACIFSAALSTVSSGINALAAVAVVDFLKPIFHHCTKTRASANLLSVFSIASAIFYGLTTTGLAYVAGLTGKAVFQIALSVFGMVGGPLLGVIVVGLFFPCVNTWGAGIGLVVSLAMSLWIGIGSILNPSASKMITVSTEPIQIENSTLPANNASLANVTTDWLASNNTNMTTFLDFLNATTSVNMVSASLELVQNVTSGVAVDDLVTFTHTRSTSEAAADFQNATERSLLDTWYNLSYLHYSTLSVLVSVVVGLVVSAFTGFNRGRVLDPNTYYDVMSCCRKEAKQTIDISTIQYSKARRASVTDSIRDLGSQGLYSNAAPSKRKQKKNKKGRKPRYNIEADFENPAFDSNEM